MNNYIEKYKPNKSTDFIGHFKFVNDFKTKLKTNKFNKIIVCIGHTGIGKTSLLESIFNELNYDYKKFINLDTFKEEIDNFINCKTINQFFNKKDKLIFIDDIEVLFNDKNLGSYLVNLDNKNIPVVITLNKIYSRKFNEFLKKSEIFYMSKPPLDKIYNLLITICDEEKIKLKKKTLEKLKNIIKENNFNIKYILSNLKELIKDSNNSINYNEVDMDLYDSINILVKTKFDIREIENKGINDFTLLSLLMHENFFTYFTKNSLSRLNLDVLDIYEDILDDTLISDKLEYTIFKNSNWSIYRILCILKLSKLNKYYSKIEMDTFNKFVFTQVLTKYSLRHNLIKKIYDMLDNYNLNYEYNELLILKLLKDIENDNETKLEFNKNYLDILKKYNKYFNLIDNKLLKKY